MSDLTLDPLPGSWLLCLPYYFGPPTRPKFRFCGYCPFGPRNLHMARLPVTEVPLESRPLSAAVTTLLLVDDVDSTRLMTKWFLESFGFIVQCARSAEEGLAVFDRKVHDLVITDNHMPGMNGAEMAHIIKLRSPGTGVVLYSGLAPEDTSCFDSLVAKPIELPLLKSAIDLVLGRSMAAKVS